MTCEHVVQIDAVHRYLVLGNVPFLLFLSRIVADSVATLVTCTFEPAQVQARTEGGYVDVPGSETADSVRVDADGGANLSQESRLLVNVN